MNHGPTPYGQFHRNQRKRVLKPGVECVHCGTSIDVSVLDHEPPLSRHVHVEGSGCCVGVPSCTKCSRVQGGFLGAESTWGPRPETFEIPDPEGFPADDSIWNQCPWLDRFREVPPEGTWPRLMSPPHPRAVGSYGDEAAEWLRREAGIELRYWQALELSRQFEFDDRGWLVWLEVLLSTARQSGKSTVLRAGATWRLHQAERFGEEQTLLHTGKDLPVCKEVQRLARVWAKERGYVVREQNGNEQITSPDGSRWIIRGKGSVYGYPASAVLVDEAFGVASEVVEDGLEPTMLERLSPQMLLASTANRKATPLFPNRRASVLADLSTAGEALLVEWSARRYAAIDDRDAWRQASPHWSAQRERMLEARLARVAAGESVDVDEDIPVESFRAQFLNIWPGTLVPAGTGERLLSEVRWSELRVPEPEAFGRIWVAVEDNFGQGAAVAAVRRIDGDRFEVDGWLCDSFDEAMRDARRVAETGDAGSTVIVGASLASRVRNVVRAGATESRHGLPLLRELVEHGRLVHDRTPELDEQICSVRVREVSGGLNVVPGCRADIVRALSWAVREAVVPRPVPAIR